MSDAHGRIDALQAEVQILRHLIENMHRPGTVTDVDYSDATKPRVRIQIGTDDQGQPVKSPWLPVASFAGEMARHHPVTKGQQMMMHAPDGNHENGYLVPYSFSQKIPSPSTDAASYVDKFGQYTHTIEKTSVETDVGNLKVTHSTDSLLFDMDGTTFAFSKSGLVVNGGTLSHNGLDIGSTHLHTEVVHGSDLSGPPDSA